jgi:hypothetical protein
VAFIIFYKKKNDVQVQKKFKSENTNIYINKKRSVESTRNVCSADLDDSLGKEEIYLSKVIIYDV